MAITLSGCEIPLLLEEEDDASINLQPAQYAELAGWNNDDHAEALKAFLRSCEKIKALPEDQNFGAGGKAGKAGEWKKAESARLFFESSFRPFLVSSNWHSTGLFTGYYEIALDGGLDERQKPQCRYMACQPTL
jgi:membrane-bound lytic murein transglycosylase A